MTEATPPPLPPLVLVGAGGHAKVVIEVARAAGRFNLVGLIDPRPAAPEVLGVPVLGGDEILPRLRAEGVAWAFVALGGNAAARAHRRRAPRRRASAWRRSSTRAPW